MLTVIYKNNASENLYACIPINKYVLYMYTFNCKQVLLKINFIRSSLTYVCIFNSFLQVIYYKIIE